MSDDILRRLAGLDSSTLSDVLDVSGYTGQVLAADLRPLDPAKRFVGRAVTARGEVGAQAGSFSPYDIENHVAPGEVVVIATGRFTIGAVSGGMVTLQYLNRGCTGLVTDGAVRDALEIASYGFPTVCAAVTPANSAGRFSITTIGEEVALPGLAVDLVTIAPGDYILGDNDGTVVIPQAIILPVIEATERSVVIERTITQEIKDGSSREAAFARHPRFAHIPKLREGQPA